MNKVRVVGAVAIRNGRLLMAKRPSGKTHGGLWELPGGKVEPGETDHEALARELLEELATPAKVVNFAGSGGDDKVTLVCYYVELLAEPIPLFHEQISWVPLDKVAELETPPSDQNIILNLI